MVIFTEQQTWIGLVLMDRGYINVFPVIHINPAGINFIRNVGSRYDRVMGIDIEEIYTAPILIPSAVIFRG